MFTKEKVLKAAGTLAIVLVALAIHQKYIAPKLAPKAPAKA